MPEFALHDLPSFQTRKHEHGDLAGDSYFEVLFDLRDLRKFRSSLTEAVRHTKSHQHLIMLLVGPLVSLERLKNEAYFFQESFRADLAARITTVVSDHEGLPMVLVGKLSEAERQAIPEILAQARREEKERAKSVGDGASDILRILLNQWFRRAGPLTSLWLAEAAGCSYPTVASALEKLDRHLTRHSDRRVELNSFPREAWYKLLANSDKIRRTLRFADHSGQPRSVESLIERLRKLSPPGVSLGGVAAAREYHREVDLVGLPRLDLTIRSRSSKSDLSFLRKLDPALEPQQKGEPCRLVLHFVGYPFDFSKPGFHGSLPLADPVECLLDLHELRLEEQAAAFLRQFAPS